MINDLASITKYFKKKTLVAWARS